MQKAIEQNRPARVIISSLSANSIGGATGYTSLGTSAPASATWPVANEALFIPFRIAEPILVQQLFWQNGATVTGNMDVGIYSVDGTRLISSGSTAMSGANVIQAVDVTDTLIGAGVYYFALVGNSAANCTTFRKNPSLNQLKCHGMASQTASFPLPATVTLASLTQGYVPIVGLIARTVI